MTEPENGDSTSKNDTPARVSTPPISLPGISIRASTIERRSVPSSLHERYDEIVFLGEGGMGTVYRARDKRLGRLVAIKVLKGLDAKLGERFLLEARSQAKIQHDHVCRVYEAGEADGEPFIVMQYIDGEPLSKMASRLTIEQRVKVMREISSAVHEAHRLGLIHRDIKPSNILVETQSDGLKPYIMDFGLAKEVADQGQTMSGAVLGTPAYMSPEQARGELKQMDRRSDVYSLGATLYDILAGQAPFVAPHTWKLIMMVAYEDAPALSTVKKGLPGDLETIVMKCLERDTSRRYDSARALGDDLQRFLDAEPIQGRRASLGYVLWKKARKHKFVTALGSVALVSAISLGGLWVKARRDAAVQASIGQEFGENVKEMELFLRAAYALPLHDVEVERDVVRRKLATIEMRMREVGKLADGPGHYALGRGNLALGDPTKAREHLEKAVTAGYRSAALEIALGQTLGELYRRALEETKRISTKAEREKREAELASSLRDPALVHLRAATGTEIESPAYVEGLIALYEGKNEEARTKAQKAFELAPWMYEAKKLEADALFAEGSKYRHDAAFDWEKMMLSFGPAAEAYKTASRMGESDPATHLAECVLWEKKARAADAEGQQLKSEINAALAACSEAVAASSREGETRVQRANVLQYRFWKADKLGIDAAAIEKETLDAVEIAIQYRPDDLLARYVQATTRYVQVMSQGGRGERVDIADAVRAYERVLVLEPRYVWAMNELAQTYLVQAEYDRLHGGDPRPTVEQARKWLIRAMEVDPDFTLPLYAVIRGINYRLVYETEHGIEAAETLRLQQEAFAAIEKRKLGGFLPAYYGAKSNRLRAAYEFSQGNDPRSSIQTGLDKIAAFANPGSETGFMLMESAELRLLQGEYLVQHREDFPFGLSPLRDRLQQAAEQEPADIDFHDLVARADLLLARRRVHAGSAQENDFSRALGDLETIVKTDRNDPRPYLTLADITLHRAKWLHGQKKLSAQDLGRGLALIEKALTLHPHSGKGWAIKAELLSLNALISSGEEHKTTAARAREAFGAAIRENPRMEKGLAEIIDGAKAP